MQRSHRSSRWNWLLLIPTVLPLATFLLNAEGPSVGGFPLFSWLQLLFVGLVVAVTTLVHQLTKRER